MVEIQARRVGVTACVSINRVCAFHKNASLSSFFIWTGIFFQQSIDCSVFVSQRTNSVELSSPSHFSPISFSYVSVCATDTGVGFFPLRGECTNCALQSAVLITGHTIWLQWLLQSVPSHVTHGRATLSLPVTLCSWGKCLQGSWRDSKGRLGTDTAQANHWITETFNFPICCTRIIRFDWFLLIWFVLFFSHRINCCWYLGSDFLPFDGVWGKRKKKYSLSNNLKVVNNENSLYVKFPVPCSS